MNLFIWIFLVSLRSQRFIIIQKLQTYMCVLRQRHTNYFEIVNCTSVWLCMVHFSQEGYQFMLLRLPIQSNVVHPFWSSTCYLHLETKWTVWLCALRHLTVEENTQSWYPSLWKCPFTLISYYNAEQLACTYAAPNLCCESCSILHNYCTQ